jgi:hypothetical protein
MILFRSSSVVSLSCRRVVAGLAILLTPLVAAAQEATSALPGTSITNEGVFRADSAVNAVFLERTRLTDTVDVGDFTAYLIARMGAPPFEEGLAFRVTADSARARISGRLMDFPADTRSELGPIFSFVDSMAPFVAEVGLVERANGIMRWRLMRVTVNGWPIPDFLLTPALRDYNRRYPVLGNNGRDFLVAMPPEATVALVSNGLELRMP